MKMHSVISYFSFFSSFGTADVDNESTESDDEFQICDICNGEEVTYSRFLIVMQPCYYCLLSCTV